MNADQLTLFPATPSPPRAGGTPARRGGLKRPTPPTAGSARVEFEVSADEWAVIRDHMSATGQSVEAVCEQAFARAIADMVKEQGR